MSKSPVFQGGLEVEQIARLPRGGAQSEGMAELVWSSMLALYLCVSPAGLGWPENH